MQFDRFFLKFPMKMKEGVRLYPSVSPLDPPLLIFDFLSLFFFFFCLVFLFLCLMFKHEWNYVYDVTLNKTYKKE